MKKVAGYDAAKLFLGAWGPLGVIVEVPLRTPPRPADVLDAGPVTPPDFTVLPSADLHRRLKDVFDPRGLLNPSLFRHDPA